ncbi:MAG TPA: sensor histidine kinase [Polyangiaceae bacterium]|nr:sensor histidine kinase [Polyangiaceae bacterium]
MSGDRLTRTELSWLLTQEAKSAADKLRKGVGLTTPPPAPTIVGTPPTPPVATILPGPSEDTGVEGVLNRLDETMSMLASLYGNQPRGRRGRIDVAALLWEIAPEARVQIDMENKGLVVFGDESELRRMLHVLMALGGDPTTQGAMMVGNRRDDDKIKIAVELGPDKTQGFDAETQWLSRMTTRYGGELLLEGNTNTLVLPASDDDREVESLRRELAAAQAQGEAVARELAAVISSRSEPPPPNRTGTTGSPSATDGLAPLVGMARSLVTDVRGILAAIGRDMAPLRERGRWGERDAEIAEVASSVGRHVTAASEVVGDLARLAGCPLFELPGTCNLLDHLRDVVKSEQIRASRHGVQLLLHAPDSVSDDLLPMATTHIFIQELLDSAISVSPSDSQVEVRITESATGVVITVDDAGPALTQKAKSGAVNRDFDALVQERTAALPLIAAFALAAHLHAPLNLEDAPSGGTRARVVFPRTTG